MALPDGTMGWAAFSADNRYRYSLNRRWAPVDKGFVLWIMLNPSTAGATEDDPTIRRCCGFAKSWGYDGIVVCNLFARIATRPVHLASEPSWMSQDEEHALGHRVRSGQVSRIVAAWGANAAAARRSAAVIKLVTRDVQRDLWALGTTKAGAPKHPLYVASATEPVIWKTRRAA